MSECEVTDISVQRLSWQSRNIYPSQVWHSLFTRSKVMNVETNSSGLAMRLFSFLEPDQDAAGKNLRNLGRRSTANDKTLAVLLYPEESLVSPDTRAKSAKDAAKLGIVRPSAPFRGTLNPRIHFCCFFPYSQI